MSKKAIILIDKLGNKLYPAAYKDDQGNVIRTTYQGKLVSGVNIKTINGQSVLGSGDVSIIGGVWGSISGDINNQTDLIEVLDDKQDTLVSGTNIKTVGNESILGSGNLPIITEYANQSAFPATGISTKLYLAIDTKKTYRWDGTAYEEISPEATVTVTGSGNAITNITDSNGALTATKGSTFITSSYVYGTSCSDTNKLWLDSNANGGLKYYNGSSWVPVPVLFG